MIMKNLKKILAVMLAVVLAASCMSVLGYSAEKEYVPTILIPGLFQCEVKYYENDVQVTDSNGNYLAEPFFINADEEFITNALTTALVPVMSMLITQEDKEQKAAEAIANIIGELLMGRNESNAQGEMIDDVRPTVYKTSFAEMNDHDKASILEHYPLEEYFDIAGEEYLYVFSYVSTGNMIEIAHDFYDYIQYVKEISGSDKVNIVPISQGGTVCNGMMKVYEEKGISPARDINRIVYVVPALDGAALIGDIYQRGFNDNTEVFYTTMLPSVLGVENYLPYLINILLRIVPNADIMGILDKSVDVLIRDYLAYSTMLWALCPSADYEVCREMYLATSDMAEIRKQADWYYEAQVNSEKYLTAAINDGVKAFDIVDVNVELYQIADSYDKINSDGMIQLDSTSMGAYSTGVYEKLPEDYVPARNNCKNPAHDHTDPEGVVDVCSGLLPDTTFYFSGQNHPETGSNDVIMSLIVHLLTDENFTSVYSYPEKFPQFNKGRNTLNLRMAMEEMEAYDKSNITPEQAAELEGAIDQVNDMLANTIVDVEEFKAAEARYMAIHDEIMAEGALITDKGINRALYIITKTVSDLLYFFFEDAAFSEMSYKQFWIE